MEQLLEMSKKFAPHMPQSYHIEFVRQVLYIKRMEQRKQELGL